MAYVVVFAELALGLGLVLGFLTPIALVFSILLNLLYFVLMISDWAEQGQNLMMILAAAVVARDPGLGRVLDRPPAPPVRGLNRGHRDPGRARGAAGRRPRLGRGPGGRRRRAGRARRRG